MALTVETERMLAAKFEVLFPHLDERQRRLWMGAEARTLGHGGIRAVARACATNPVAGAIPCHRVLRTNGDLGGYRWGMGRKKALLELEASSS